MLEGGKRVVVASKLLSSTATTDDNFPPPPSYAAHTFRRGPPLLIFTHDGACKGSIFSLSLSAWPSNYASLPPPYPPLLHSLARDTQGKEKWKKDVLGEKEMPVCPSPPPLPHFSSAHFPFPVCLPAAHAFVRFDGVVAGKREEGGWGEQGQDLYLSLRCM